jgi:hypothetical protein
MFVKKVFQLVKPFLANLHYSFSKKYSYMYSMTPNFFYFFFNISIQKTQNFTLISNPWKKFEKSVPRKSYLPKTFTS